VLNSEIGCVERDLKKKKRKKRHSGSATVKTAGKHHVLSLTSIHCHCKHNKKAEDTITTGNTSRSVLTVINVLELSNILM